MTYLYYRHIKTIYPDYIYSTYLLNIVSPIIHINTFHKYDIKQVAEAGLEGAVLGGRKHYTEEKEKTTHRQTYRHTEKVNTEAPIIVVPMEGRGSRANTIMTRQH